MQTWNDQTQDAEISTLRDASASQPAQIDMRNARVAVLENQAALASAASPATARPGTNLVPWLLAWVVGLVAGGGLCLGAFALGPAKRA